MGAVVPEYRRGGIVKLLAFLRNETMAETVDYLRAKFGETGAADEAEPTLLPLNLTLPEPYRPLDARILEPYRYRSPYLASRGISEGVQRLMRIGYDRDRRAVVIPWFNGDGTLGNVKFRRVDTKTFWYIVLCPVCSGDNVFRDRTDDHYVCRRCAHRTRTPINGRPIREMVYGIDVVYRKRLTRAAIVEAEIDAMTLMSAGIPAIATGGSAFNGLKRDLIVKSPLEEVVVIRDNDAAGRKWQRQVIAELGPYIRVKVAAVPSRYKDVNECGGKSLENVRAIVERGRAVNAVWRAVLAV